MVELSNLKRIKWACRRGMLELDLLLLPFFENTFEKLTTLEKEGFIALLQESDQDIYNWLLGKEKPNSSIYTQLVKKIRTINEL